MKKFIALFLVFSILNISCATISPTRAEVGPKKKGADLIIQKADGIQVRGWLIAVKENSLLLMDRDSRADVSVDVKNIRAIIHVRKSKFLKGAGFGLLIGLLAGVMGAVAKVDEATEASEPDVSVLPGEAVKVAGMVGFGVLIGFIVGGIIGEVAGIDKLIQIEGKSETEIQEILEKLRKKARIKNAQ